MIDKPIHELIMESITEEKREELETERVELLLMELAEDQIKIAKVQRLDKSTYITTVFGAEFNIRHESDESDRLIANNRYNSLEIQESLKILMDLKEKRDEQIN